MLKKWLWLIAIVLTNGLAHGQCSINQLEVIVQIVPDNYPDETTWNIKNGNGTVVASGTYLSDTVCLPALGCYLFTIYDSFGDGICCGYGQGNYQLSVNGQVLASGGQFTYSEGTWFNCPPGSNCNDAIMVSEGSHVTPFGDDSWYEFSPDSTGQYLISTCSPLNNCATTIWVYDYCQGLLWDSTHQATIFYANTGCTNNALQAQVVANLSNTKTYYIRIGGTTGCSTISWSLAYQGPIAGCTDPLACNYDPLATVSTGQCIYPGDPNCGIGPDLEVLQNDLTTSLYMTNIFNNDVCLVQEGCVTGYGQRHVVRFTTHIENTGNLDYYIGQPPANPSQPNTQWEWDLCHGHWHYEGYAEYILFDTLGNELPVGFKNGFCVMDLDCSLGGGTPKYGCNDQGISAQCGDIYDSNLQCQWIDITDVPNGLYTFVIRVNWDKSPDALGRHETNYFNNWAQACIRITRDWNNVPQFTLEPNCQPFIDCNGEIYGDARPDCTGDCNGTVVTGDLNADTLLNYADVLNYLQQSLDDTLLSTPCNDLNDDQQTSVLDAALALECIRHANDPLYTGNHVPCEFPHDVLNINQNATLALTNLDLTAGSVDVTLLNPYSRVLAVDFECSGVPLTGAISIFPNYNPMILFSQDEVVVLDTTEVSLPKHNQPTPYLRLFFDPQMVYDSLCISNIVSITNDQLEQVIPIKGSCLWAFPVSTQPLNPTAFQVTAQPNPFTESLTFSSNHAPHAAYNLQLLDAMGRLIWQANNIATSNYTLSTAHLPAGVYWYKIQYADGVTTGKVIKQ